MMRRGFTIVELVITVTIIGILLTLAVVNMNGSQVKARDSERKADVEVIALSLESFYSNKRDSGGTWQATNTYMAISPLTKTSIVANLGEIDPKVLYAPAYDGEGDQTSLVSATNAVQTTAGVTPQPTINQYVYQPLTAEGTRCTSPTASACRKFNIFYRLETDNSVQMVTSKNQ